MTKKTIERALYINESKKRRKEKASKNRKDWVGMRPAYYQDKTKYNRKSYKEILDI
jgi:hypothetical protein